MIKVTVSGKTFYGGMDPLCTDVPKEMGWPKPAWRSVGKGHQAVYEVTKWQASTIAGHLEVLAEGFSYSDDPYTRSEGRAFAKDARKIREQLRP